MLRLSRQFIYIKKVFEECGHVTISILKEHAGYSTETQLGLANAKWIIIFIRFYLNLVA